jgi:hypothetical protein
MAMEADWEVEIGPGAPIIEAFWPAFVDLRTAPERIREIEEASKFPALADALMRLNKADTYKPDSAPDSPVWTAKCDLWTLQQCDPDEMHAVSEECATGLACYIDLMPREGLVFSGLPETESWARALVIRLRRSSCRCSRTDLVIRRAYAGNVEGLGVTVYIAACGTDSVAAANTLVTALAVFVDALCGYSGATADRNWPKP